MVRVQVNFAPDILDVCFISKSRNNLRNHNTNAVWNMSKTWGSIITRLSGVGEQTSWKNKGVLTLIVNIVQVKSKIMPGT